MLTMSSFFYESLSIVESMMTVHSSFVFWRFVSDSYIFPAVGQMAKFDWLEEWGITRCS